MRHEGRGRSSGPLVEELVRLLPGVLAAAERNFVVAEAEAAAAVLRLTRISVSVSSVRRGASAKVSFSRLPG